MKIFALGLFAMAAFAASDDEITFSSKRTTGVAMIPIVDRGPTDHIVLAIPEHSEVAWEPVSFSSRRDIGGNWQGDE